MWHKPCRTFHPWCLCIKTRCLLPTVMARFLWGPRGTCRPGTLGPRECCFVAIQRVALVTSRASLFPWYRQLQRSTCGLPSSWNVYSVEWEFNGRRNVSHNWSMPRHCAPGPFTSLPWWHHGMDTLSILLTLYKNNPLVIVEFPAQTICKAKLLKISICQWDVHLKSESFPRWRHQMETFSALLAICAGNSTVPVNYPHKGQWRRALICAWINRLSKQSWSWWIETLSRPLWRHRDVSSMLVSQM